MGELITALQIALAIATGQLQSGNLSAYDVNPTKYTLQHRVEAGEIEVWQVQRADVLLAVVDCSRIGEFALVRIDDGEWQTALIFDCAVRSGHDGTLSWMEQNNILGEVDYSTWNGLVAGVQHQIEVVWQ